MNTQNTQLDGYYVIRCRYSGAFLAKIVSHSENYQVLHLADSRRLWRWEGASSLSDLAINGVANPDDCLFPVALEKQIVTDAIEIISTTEEAVEKIKNVKTWTMHNN